MPIIHLLEKIDDYLEGIEIAYENELSGYVFAVDYNDQQARIFRHGIPLRSATSLSRPWPFITVI